MSLEPITENHADEMCELFSDSELHRFVPLDVPTIEEQRQRCLRWSKRQSPDGSEFWLNWAGRDKVSGKIDPQTGNPVDGSAPQKQLTFTDLPSLVEAVMRQKILSITRSFSEMRQLSRILNLRKRSFHPRLIRRANIFRI